MRSMFRVLAKFTFISLLFAGSVAQAATDREILLEGVAELPTTGTVGGVSVIGPDAFAVLAGKEGKVFSPVVAASKLGKGKVVALAHNGYLGKAEDPDVARLIANSVRWIAGEKAKVGVRANNSLGEMLAGRGFEVVQLEGIDWVNRIGGLAAICIDSHILRLDRDVPALDKFIRAGGGLVTSATGWGWLQGHSGKSLAVDFPGSVLLRPAGLVFNGRTPERTGKAGFLAAQPADFTLLNATAALAALETHEDQSKPLDKAALAQAGATVAEAVQALPGDDTAFLPRIGALVAKSGYTHPLPEKPLTSDQALARLLVTFTVEQLKRAKPEQIRLHPAAAGFPGSVPADAPVENRKLTIDTHRPGWHSTGLYAAPGAMLRVEIPSDAVAKGLRARIGCHRDSLWHHEKWSRVPEITVSAKLSERETRVANAFGGPVYIEVPDKMDGFPIEVTVNGAIGAPYYVLGTTTAAEWQKQRVKPAPWAEIECGKVILSVPSSTIRTLQDPEQLAKFWNRVIELEDELAAKTTERRRPERIVADVQISAGYMHSGYPIMTHLDAATHSTDLARMQQGSWGHFHEVGHNQQSGDWTFEGTGEVTCNIFALYVSEKLCGLPPGAGHDAMEPARRARRLERHLRGDPSQKFDRWKSDPFLALTMYHQLRIGFGWEPYIKVFTEYRDLSRSERPKTDQEKRDQWMMRFSRTVGRNLAPFFAAWGVPVTDGAVEEVKNLPAWMPEDWPKIEAD